MTLLVILLVTAVLTVLLMTALPAKADAEAAAGKHFFSVSLTFALLCGLVRVKIDKNTENAGACLLIAGRSLRLRARKKKKENKYAPGESSGVTLKKTVFKRGFRMLPGLLSALRRHIHIERLHIDIRGGFSDPALTGMLYGYIHSLEYICPLSPRVRILADFRQNCWEGEVQAAARFTPLILLTAAARIWFSDVLDERFKRRQGGLIHGY